MEWCWDWFGNYSSEIQKDPIGASSGAQRVCRGCSWLGSGQYARSAFRLGCDPYSKNNFIGFRIARPL
jgi:formylglycine-generating enzyme required for sulfatase activity